MSCELTARLRTVEQSLIFLSDGQVAGGIAGEHAKIISRSRRRVVFPRGDFRARALSPSTMRKIGTARSLTYCAFQNGCVFRCCQLS